VATPGGPIVLYDGVCALCNGIVRFTLARDRQGTFRYAPLQGALARETLSRHGRNPDDLNTFVVVVDPGLPTERLLQKSTGAAFVLSQLPGVWRPAGALVRAVPRALRDAAYDLVARNRYRTFGKYEACPVPPPEHRARFL
jgi:predicted DCC family thiol-disulfide oxidoreductase YuxK